MGNRVHKSQTSFSENAVVATTYADDYITRGNGFQVKKRITLTSAQTLYVEFAINNHSGFVYALAPQFSTAGGLVYIDTYNADSSTGGSTLATPINLNGKSSITAKTTVKIGVTVSGSAINVREYIAGTKSTNQSSGSGASGIDVPRLLNNSKPLYFKIVNQESAEVILNIGYVWYEI